MRRAIETRGPLTFAAFMEAALYDPEDGYYTGPRVPWGRHGDYLTAPQVHPAVGGAIAVLAAEMDAALGEPEPFTLVEAGSGDGRLLAAVCGAIEAARPALYGRLSVCSVERSERARRRQEEILRAPPGGLRQAAELDELAADLLARGGIYSNELLDALPVHRVTVVNGELREVFVGFERGSFVEILGRPSTPLLEAHLQANGIHLRDGQVAEIALDVEPWVAAVNRCLEAGFLLTIDYGSETESLYGEQRLAGTLVCHHRYRVHDDPFANVGGQDITAHVDFGNLRRCGRQLGLADGELVSLRVFLMGFGAADGRAEEGRSRAHEHLALRHLLFSEIGETHSVLLQTKGLPAGAVPFGRERLSGGSGGS